MASLNSKSKEELIKIILRKDKTEKRNNKKIQELTQELSNSNKRRNISTQLYWLNYSDFWTPEEKDIEEFVTSGYEEEEIWED